MVFNGLIFSIFKRKGVLLLETYDSLPLEILVEFYYYIIKNIEEGILSHAMYYELNLIKQVAEKKGISLIYLYNQGSRMK